MSSQLLKNTICNTVYPLGCFPHCGEDVELPIDLGTGEYEIRICYHRSEICHKVSGKVSIPVSKLPINQDFTFSIYDSNGNIKAINITEDSGTPCNPLEPTESCYHLFAFKIIYKNEL